MAQTTQAAITALITTNLADNTSELITPALVRQVEDAMNDSYQIRSVEVTGNVTALNDAFYINTANATYTDPTPVQGKGYTVFVRNGTATINSVAYSVAGTVIRRVYHSGAWVSYVGEDSGTWTPTYTQSGFDAASNIRANYQKVGGYVLFQIRFEVINTPPNINGTVNISGVPAYPISNNSELDVVATWSCRTGNIYDDAGSIYIYCDTGATPGEIVLLFDAGGATAQGAYEFVLSGAYKIE